MLRKIPFCLMLLCSIYCTGQKSHKQSSLLLRIDKKERAYHSKHLTERDLTQVKKLLSGTWQIAATENLTRGDVKHLDFCDQLMICEKSKSVTFLKSNYCQINKSNAVLYQVSLSSDSLSYTFVLANDSFNFSVFSSKVGKLVWEKGKEDPLLYHKLIFFIYHQIRPLKFTTNSWGVVFGD